MHFYPAFVYAMLAEVLINNKFKIMKKGIFFKGSEMNGKTLLCKLLFNKKETLFINSRNPNLFDDHFLFSEASENTKFIVFDDISPKIRVEKIIEIQLQQKLLIKRPFKECIEIETPTIIINGCGINISNKFFFDRFDVYDLDLLSFSKILKIIKNNNFHIKTSYNNDGL